MRAAVVVTGKRMMNEIAKESNMFVLMNTRGLIRLFLLALCKELIIPAVWHLSTLTNK